MPFSNTVVGLRKGALTVVASNGLRVNSSGVILKHKANRVRRIYNDRVLIASTFTEMIDDLLAEQLNLELIKVEGDVRKATYGLAKFMATSKVVAAGEGHVVVGSGEFLGYAAADGSVVEPDEGFVSVGGVSLIATGAIIALTKHSDLRVDQIAQESLRLSGNVSQEGNDQIFLESISS